MKTRLIISLLFVALLFTTHNVYSQSDKPEFGTLNEEDFDTVVYNFENDASAIYLFEYGESEIIFEEGFYVVTKCHTKIKVLTDNGVSQGDISIPVYGTWDDAVGIADIKAVSYFKEEDGSIEENHLEKSQIFREKVSDSKRIVKFAIPNVKKGSIIEYEYVKFSALNYRFMPWTFQDYIPKLKSEYIVIIPANFIFNVRLQGNLRLNSNTAEKLDNYFSTGYGGSKNSDASKIYYSMDNIPSFKVEAYMSSASNFISMLKYELEAVKRFSFSQKYAESWSDIEKALLEDNRIGKQLNTKLLKQEVKELKENSKGELDLSKSIFDLVQTKLVFNGYNNKYTSEKGIKKALETGFGNSADINILLANALRRGEIEADLVVISTRDNGFINKEYPTLTEFNYVIVKAEIEGKTYLLDATSKNIGFGSLPMKCYNIRGKVVKKDGGWIDLKTDDIYSKNTIVTININEDLSYEADIKNIYGKHSAINFRDNIDEFNSLDDIVEDIENREDILLDNYEISDRYDINKPIIESYSMEDELSGVVKNNSIFINPIIVNRIDDNPFKLTERVYPVDFGIETRIKTIIKVTIPEGYELADKSKPIKLYLPNKGGYYQYSLLPIDKRTLLLRTSFVLNKPIYSTSEYKDLKYFYNNIITKNNSFIELTKIEITSRK